MAARILRLAPRRERCALPIRVARTSQNRKVIKQVFHSRKCRLSWHLFKYVRKKKIIYELLSLPSASLLSSGPDIIFRSPDLVITAVICKTVKSTDTELFNETERHFNVSLVNFFWGTKLTPMTDKLNSIIFLNRLWLFFCCWDVQTCVLTLDSCLIALEALGAVVSCRSPSDSRSPVIMTQTASDITENHSMHWGL